MIIFDTFSEFWEKTHCPTCHAINWVYQSHSERVYPDEKHAVRCRICKTICWLGSREDFEDRFGGELEDHTIEEVEADYLVVEEGLEGPT